MSERDIAYLRVLTGPLRGRVYVLKDLSVFEIGRGSGCQVLLKDDKCASHHGRIYRKSRTWTFFDLNTEQGSSINDIPVVKRDLEGGEILRIGTTELQFTYTVPRSGPKGDPVDAAPAAGARAASTPGTKAATPSIAAAQSPAAQSPAAKSAAPKSPAAKSPAAKAPVASVPAANAPSARPSAAKEKSAKASAGKALGAIAPASVKATQGPGPSTAGPSATPAPGAKPGSRQASERWLSGDPVDPGAPGTPRLMEAPRRKSDLDVADAAIPDDFAKVAPQGKGLRFEASPTSAEAAEPMGEPTPAAGSAPAAPSPAAVSFEPVSAAAVAAAAVAAAPVSPAAVSPTAHAHLMDRSPESANRAHCAAITPVVARPTSGPVGAGFRDSAQPSSSQPGSSQPGASPRAAQPVVESPEMAQSAAARPAASLPEASPLSPLTPSAPEEPALQPPPRTPSEAAVLRTAGALVLVVIDGDARDIGKRIELTGTGSAIIGRALEADLVLADGKVSRRHTRVDWGADGIHISDLSSANGTVVNGRPVTRTALEEGATVRLGFSVFSCERVPAPSYA